MGRAEKLTNSTKFEYTFKLHELILNCFSLKYSNTPTSSTKAMEVFVYSILYIYIRISIVNLLYFKYIFILGE